MDDIKKDPFEEYIKNLPPSRKEMGQAWSAAIGLQDVDGLKTSEYLYATARKNIDGEITIDEAGELIDSYYESRQGRTEHGTEEADKVAQRIAKLLSDKAFVFSLHNREMHVSGMFSKKKEIDPIKRGIDPINDPINIVGLSEREKKVKKRMCI